MPCPPCGCTSGSCPAVGLVAAFWPWLRVRGLTSAWVVPAAAALFASMWLTLFYGNAVMPNLWVAYGALAATGFLLRRAQGGAHPRLDLLGFAASVGFVTLVRPTDGAVLLGLLALAALVLLRLRSWPVVLAGAAAFALAFVPWAVEAVNRFGGVLPRLRDASGTEGGFLGPTSLLLAVAGRERAAAVSADLPGSARAPAGQWAGLVGPLGSPGPRRGRAGRTAGELLGGAGPALGRVGHGRPLRGRRGLRGPAVPAPGVRAAVRGGGRGRVRPGGPRRTVPGHLGSGRGGRVRGVRREPGTDRVGDRTPRGGQARQATRRRRRSCGPPGSDPGA